VQVGYFKCFIFQEAVFYYVYSLVKEYKKAGTMYILWLKSIKKPANETMKNSIWFIQIISDTNYYEFCDWVLVIDSK
jgi:hypothetical protein